MASSRGILTSLADLASDTSAFTLIGGAVLISIIASVAVNVLQQLLFSNPHEPPVVFHWFPIIGSTISYGMEPFNFFENCRKKYGDVFTFVLLGRKTTVCLGTKGNDFILNAKIKDLNAEQVYTNLTTPVFGTDVVYDCPNAKLLEQKKFVKFGLTRDQFLQYVPLIVGETVDLFTSPRWFPGDKGTVDIIGAMAELTIYTASRTLQGPEVRSRFDSTCADLYHDLDMGFSPINFMLPHVPFPHNRKRDIANKKLTDIYIDIIQARKKGQIKEREDMIWNLMGCVYKNGTPVPDKEVAHMMIALLMAGQHSSSSTSSWIMLRLAQHPEIQEELLAEQKRELGEDLPELTYDNLQKLKLNSAIIKETLRLHTPIHSVIRQVTQPMQMEGSPYVIPPSHWLLAAPGVSARDDKHFTNPMKWDPHRWEHLDFDTSDEKIDYGYGLISKGAASPYLPFGAGRHRCIGEQFAYLQIGVILATVIRHVKLSLPKDKNGEIPDTDFSSLFSQPMRPAKIDWERRDASINHVAIGGENGNANGNAARYRG